MRSVLWIIVLAVAVCTLWTPQLQGAVRPKYILLISVDGLGWQMSQSPKLKIPNLRKLASRGVIGPSESVFPANTWPAHVTMVTGCLPRKHGVVSNRYFDIKTGKTRSVWTIPRDQLVLTPTMFDVLKRAGIRSAAVLWPGSQGDSALTWNVPYVYGQKYFERGSSPGFLKELRDAGFPSHLLWRFKATNDPHTADYAVRAIARYLVGKHRPRLMAVHLDAPDSLAHDYGPDSAPVRWGIEAADRVIGEIIEFYKKAGILAKTTVFVVADHGFEGVNRSFDVHKFLHQHGLIKDPKQPHLGPVYVMLEGKMAYLYFLDPKRRASQEKKVVALLRKRPEVERLFRPSAYHKLGLPLPLQNRRMGHLVAIAGRSLVFGRVEAKGKLLQLRDRYGVHGRLPTHPLMKTVFLAAGPGIRNLKGKLSFRNIDLAPTILHLLGRSFKSPIDGRVITRILEQ